MIEALGPVFSIGKDLLRTAWERVAQVLPKRAVLGRLVRNKEDCIIVLKWMYPRDQPRNGVYLSELPDSEARRRGTQFESWVNISFVVPKDDILAANHIFLLLGNLGKKHNIDFMSVRDSSDIWDRNVICVGGHFKSTLVSRLRPLAYWNQNLAPVPGFSFRAAQRDFPVITHDLGLILKVTHPTTRRTCLLVMGGGEPGTTGAAYYLKENAKYLGRLFRGEDFAFLVRVDVQQGPQSAEPVYFSPPAWTGKWFWGPFTWRRLRSCVEGDQE